jgi:hypothetical protein
MGLATWKAVLQDGQRCPFTKHLVTVEQVGRIFCAEFKIATLKNDEFLIV